MFFNIVDLRKLKLYLVHFNNVIYLNNTKFYSNFLLLDLNHCNF